ncbi:FxSxx-COOH system tetratricopeptide repeat protein [Actinacidiphila glaucinigra]|uniref:FxSxx-COOH system tetratricopeptide repeat protein n=1 Tax=Actinacidiphila glaucinigra TaxID=235986 RepID=UPI002DDC5CA6|nr:FxSxx-COOH system tetratricopeptide repeat protein [Actinacidiphila glaucinigra]WSD59246.1 FxSxx-COOH system tetratricopeptide repeat protein [Actinacidiphila glaucinigra]
MTGAQVTVRPQNDVVTISYAGFNRPWATWIADRIERRGVHAVLQRWDPANEESLVELLTDLALSPGRVLILCSDWYFQMGPRTQAEWNQALRTVLSERPGLFHAVTIASKALPSATAGLAPAELLGLREPDAEHRLLERLGLAGLPAGPVPSRVPRFPRDTPDVRGNVPRRNGRFTGREDLLGDIYQFFTTSDEGSGVLTLHGMPGVGKTQLAAEYIHRFGSEYDVVWWTGADNAYTYREQLAGLARPLRLATGPGYGERLRAVLEALRRGEPSDRWLVVLDNADDPAGFDGILPSGSGHLLITSRNTAWGRYNSHLMPVPVYQRVESVSFVQRRAPRLTEDEADRLAGALEDLPIALDQAAAWLSESDMTMEDYLQLLREQGPDEELLSTSQDFPTSFPTALALLVNGLKETHPESVDLLRLSTCFAPGRIPIGLLQGIRRRQLPERVHSLLSSPVAWNRALATLRQYSVVSLEETGRGTAHGDEDAPDSVYLHRMVHQIVHHNMPRADHETLGAVARAALAAADPQSPGDPALWSRYAEITPHLRPSGALRSTDPAVQDLVLNCLRYLYSAGEYSAGISLAEETLGIWNGLLGPEHERIWDITHHYANLLRSTGDYTRTEEANRRVVDHLRAERGQDDLDHVRAASGLAADLRGLGRYQDALELQQWVLDTYQRLLGEEARSVTQAQNNLGISLRLLGRYEDAVLQFQAATEAAARYRGPLHTDTLNAQRGRAETLRLLGRYREAKHEQDDNLAKYAARRMEKDHPDVLRAELNLGLVHLRNGPVDQAGQEITSVVERAQRTLGDRHPDTSMYLNTLAFYIREHGDIDDSRPLSERVSATNESMLGPDHPFSAGARSNLALVLRNVGERRQASDLAEEALATMTAAVGESHPWTLGCAVNACALRHMTGEYEAAVELSETTVTRATETLGRTHPLTLSARIAYADDLRGVRRLAQAAKEEDSAITDLADTLGRGHLHTLAARNRVRPHWDFESLIS